MRNLIFILCVFIGSINSSYSQSETLSDINTQWNFSNCDFNLELDLTSLSENQKIQLHLKLVEENLRKKPTNHLSPQQKFRRNQTLNILNHYWNAGVFPKNIYHEERTPYFIDHLGTHCAVGHLMKETGYGSVATQIHRQNNYGYVFDLVHDFPEITTWAEHFGFTIQELAWIQPGYPICHTDCNHEIYLWVDTWNTPYVGPFDFFFPELNLSTDLLTEMCPNEEYEIVVTDSNGLTVENNDIKYGYLGQAVIGTAWSGTVHTPWTDVPEVSFQTERAGIFCNGEIEMEVTNEVEVTNLTWTHPPGSGQSLTNACHGWHYVNIETDFVCNTEFSVYVSPDYTLCEGDLNMDFLSNSSDLTLFLNYYGCQEHCEADLNYDGKTAADDLTIFLSNFGLECIIAPH